MVGETFESAAYLSALDEVAADEAARQRRRRAADLMCDAAVVETVEVTVPTTNNAPRIAQVIADFNLFE